MTMRAGHAFPGVPRFGPQEDEHSRALTWAEDLTLEYSPQNHLDATCVATDVLKLDVSRDKPLRPGLDMQQCMISSEECSMIDAPHAWRTGFPDWHRRTSLPCQLPQEFEIRSDAASGRPWTPTEQDTYGTRSSWSPRTSDSRSEAGGVIQCQPPSWNDHSQGIGLHLIHLGGAGCPPNTSNDLYYGGRELQGSVSPKDIQQYPDEHAEDYCERPDSQVTGTGHSFFPENIDLFTPDEGSVAGYAEAIGSPIQNGSKAVSINEEDDASMDDDAECDVDDEYIPTVGSHGPGSALSRGLLVAKNAKPVSKRSQRSNGFAPTNLKPAKIAKKASKPSASSPIITRGLNQTSCTQCPHTCASKSELKKHVLSKHNRPFICTFYRYGCHATVGSKNEWKRHINVQHLHLETWRCDMGSCARRTGVGNSVPGFQQHSQHSAIASYGDSERSNHDFDRKDLFTQHIKRMHAPALTAPRAERTAFEVGLPKIQDRCHLQLRQPPPRSRCPYCPRQVFEGPGSWTDRLEHVGKHLEKGNVKREDEVEDEDLRDWMRGQDFLTWEATEGKWRVNNIDGKKRKKSVVPADEEDAEGESDVE